MKPLDPWSLPTSLSVGGREYRIRTDFRAVLDVLAAAADPELDKTAAALVMIKIIYPDAETIPYCHLPEAAEAACAFIDAGTECGESTAARLYDWRRDAPLIASAVAAVAGRDVRAEPYLHWWTFLSYFLSVGEGAFSSVVAIRDKRRRRLPLSQAEERFVRENRQLFAPPGGGEEEERLLSMMPVRVEKQTERNEKS